ncbi:MAG: glycosyltransferase [Lachnospiraceae bacterium]|nr:glycosyltransferase [Lachnospiraceae bacterium]
MTDKKIVVDVVCPKGGLRGGVEDVIRAWTKNINPEIFDLRIMHMTPGIAYLEGYKKAYFLKEEKDVVDPNYCASGYNLFLEQLGPADICVATNNPVMSHVCDYVRKYRNLDMKVFSWIHTEAKRYEERGNGGIREMLYADRHLTLNAETKRQLIEADPNAIVYDIGNPIIHELPVFEDEKTDERKLVFVGRLSIEKRLDLILEAMYKAKSKWSLDIVGEGDITEEVKGWIKLMKLEKRVRLLGWMDNPLYALKGATAVVAASDYEGFMVSGAEALAMGKTLISTPTEGVKAYLKDGENGYFFDFDDANSLALILDGIASGQKKIPASDICQKSVERYLPENYFSNLEKIFIDAYNS